MVIRSLGSWRQSICPLRFQSPAVKDTRKGAQKWHEGAKQPIRQLGEQRYRTMKGCHLRSTYYFARNTEGETLKAKSEGFQEDHTGWFQTEGVLFLPGNLQGKLVNSLHATTHLGEKALQTLLERTFRGTGIQMTLRQVVPSCPTCQLNNPEGAPRPQPIQQHGTHPGEEWQTDFTQMPVSQGYKYLLVMIDTFTGWIEGFPTGTEKVEKLVKKKKTAP